MAHALWNYDGACKNIHGHSYKLYVTLIGNIKNDKTSPKNGMVIDFSDINNIVKSAIINKFDHALVISEDAVYNSQLLNQLSEKIIITGFQPTVENLLIYFTDILNNKIPDHVKLYSLKLQETETSYAEWFSDDN